MNYNWNIKFDYLKKDTVLASVGVLNGKVSVVNFTNDIVDRPFGRKENLTVKDVENLFKFRSFPEERVNTRQLIEGKFPCYDAYSIVKVTHGIMIDDYYWIRFKGENLSWDDVKHWKYH